MAKPLTPAVAKRRIADWASDPCGTLDLSTLTALTEDLARMIGGLIGDVNLGDVADIPDGCAVLLQSHKGSLSLGGVTRLGHAAAAALAKHDGWLHLGIVEIEDDVALVLAAGIATLGLSKLTRLSNSPGHLALARKLIEENTFDRLYALTESPQELRDMQAAHSEEVAQARKTASETSWVSGLDLDIAKLTQRDFFIRCGAAVEEIARAIEREIEMRPGVLYNDKARANYIAKKLRDAGDLL